MKSHGNPQKISSNHEISPMEIHGKFATALDQNGSHSVLTCTAPTREVICMAVVSGLDGT